MLPTAFLLLSIIQTISTHQILYEGDKCSIKGTTGTCKQLKDCDSAVESLKKGITPPNCGFIGFTPIVCCGKAVKRITSREKCKEYTDIREKQDRLFYTAVVGGEDAKPEEFPHMAALGYGPANNLKWNCGGALISEEYVLTAAHCVTTNNQVSYVRLGDYKLDGSSKTRRDYKVVRIITHPDYKPPLSYNDIALLKLERKVKFNTGTVPACLPTTKKSPEFIQAIGWGLTEFGGNPSNILQKVNLESFSLEECNRVYKSDRRRLSQGIRNDVQICAGSKKEEKDTCQGDSGGPLHHLDGTLYTVIGITSFGKSCGTPGVPGVYTNVYNYIEWIEDNIWNPKR